MWAVDYVCYSMEWWMNIKSFIYAHLKEASFCIYNCAQKFVVPIEPWAQLLCLNTYARILALFANDTTFNVLMSDIHHQIFMLKPIVKSPNLLHFTDTQRIKGPVSNGFHFVSCNLPISLMTAIFVLAHVNNCTAVT